MNPEGYFVRSARIVLRDRTWWWRTAALAVIQLVPIAGVIVLVGYEMMLMRDAAWGVDRGLPKFSKGSEILRNGAYGYAVMLVWSLVIVPVTFVMVAGLLFSWLGHMVPGVVPVAPWWFYTPISALAVALSVWINVALVRTAVYQKIGAGLSPFGVRGLITAGRAGFARVTGLMLSVGITGILLAALSAYVRQVVLHLSGLPSTAALYGWALVIDLVFIPLHLVVACAYGLWAAETDPTSWPPLGPVARAADPDADGSPVLASSTDGGSNPSSGAAPALDTSDTAPTLEAPRGMRWPWAVVVASILLVMAATVWTFTLVQGWARAIDASITARSRAGIAAEADAARHWKAAATSLATIRTVYDGMQSQDPAWAQQTLPGLASSLTTMKTVATPEVSAVDRTIPNLPSTDMQADYGIAVGEARDAISKAAATAPALETLPSVYAQCQQIAAVTKRIRGEIGAAATANGSARWDSAIHSSSHALGDCAAAQRLLEKLKAEVAAHPVLSDQGGVAQAVEIVARERALAQLAAGAAAAGKSSSKSRYDAARNRYDQAAAAAGKIKDPAFFDDPTVFAYSIVSALDHASDLVDAANEDQQSALHD